LVKHQLRRRQRRYITRSLRSWQAIIFSKEMFLQAQQRSLWAGLSSEKWLAVTYLLMERQKSKTLCEVPGNPLVERAALPWFKLILTYKNTSNIFSNIFFLTYFLLIEIRVSLAKNVSLIHKQVKLTWISVNERKQIKKCIEKCVVSILL